MVIHLVCGNTHSVLPVLCCTVCRWITHAPIIQWSLHLVRGRHAGRAVKRCTDRSPNSWEKLEWAELNAARSQSRKWPISRNPEPGVLERGRKGRTVSPEGKSGCENSSSRDPARHCGFASGSARLEHTRARTHTHTPSDCHCDLEQIRVTLLSWGAGNYLIQRKWEPTFYFLHLSCLLLLPPVCLPSSLTKTVTSSSERHHT